jgi:hypothetical protein
MRECGIESRLRTIGRYAAGAVDLLARLKDGVEND